MPIWFVPIAFLPLVYDKVRFFIAIPHLGMYDFEMSSTSFIHNPALYFWFLPKQQLAMT
jgi:hypothetical protein